MKDKPSFKTWDSGNKLFASNRKIYDISGIPPKKVLIYLYLYLYIYINLLIIYHNFFNNHYIIIYYY